MFPAPRTRARRTRAPRTRAPRTRAPRTRAPRTRAIAGVPAVLAPVDIPVAVDISIDVDVDLPGEAFLPDDYVPEMRQKIDIYRRLTRMANVNDLRQLRDELNDRFGSPPDQVERLFKIAELKIDAAVWQVTAIYAEDRFLVFQYADSSRIHQLAKSSGKRLRIVDDEKAYLPLLKRVTDFNMLMKLAKSVLRPK